MGSLISNFGHGLREIIQAISEWRIAHLLGVSLLRNRYARSKLGQFWVTLSTGITFLAFGFVWSILWKLPIADYLPYLAVAQTFWILMTTSMAEATGCLPASNGYFLNNHATFWTVIFSVVYRNLIIMTHNFVVIILIALFFGVSPNWTVLLIIPAIILVVLFTTLCSFLIALMCARFRDVIQLVNNALTVAFFVTPIMWKPEFISETHRWVVLYNPFASFIALATDPILGRPINVENWYIALGWVGLLLVIVPPVVGACRKRVIFWM